MRVNFVYPFWKKFVGANKGGRERKREIEMRVKHYGYNVTVGARGVGVRGSGGK